jgi:hypothetical protein
VYQYRIEKDRLAITIKLEGGDCIEGFIFVQPSVYRHLGREEPIDLFNAPEPFFPLVRSDGTTLLVAKDRVIEAWPIEPSDDDELRLAGTQAARLELILRDGTVRCGTMPLELPSDRPRLLDFLNSHHERFLALHAADAIRLINTHAIKCVRPLD